MEITAKTAYRSPLAIFTLAIVALGALFAGWGVLLLLPANLGEGYHSSLAAVRAVREVLLWKVAIIYASIFLFIVLAMVMLHLFYSHRIAGPSYRLGREAANIARGDLTGTIILRRKDGLADLKDGLNDVTAQYRARIITLSECLAAIERESATLSNLLRKGNDDGALRQTAATIVTTVNTLEHILSKVTT